MVRIVSPSILPIDSSWGARARALEGDVLSEAVALQRAERVRPTMASAVAAAPVAAPRMPALPIRWAKDSFRLSLELAGLWTINKAGYLAVSSLHVPLPGNVAGMLLLLALLCTGVVPARLFERSSTLLARHLAFFFVPIAVGLMDLGPTVVSYGWQLLLVLVGSAAVGLCVTGWVAQLLSRLKRQP
jgi:holin-like protein